MITENLHPADLDPKDKNAENKNPTSIPVNSEEKDKEKEDEDEGDYEILPSNDSGITADDNAATGKLHQREGD